MSSPPFAGISEITRTPADCLDCQILLGGADEDRKQETFVSRSSPCQRERLFLEHDLCRRRACPSADETCDPSFSPERISIKQEDALSAVLTGSRLWAVVCVIRLQGKGLQCYGRKLRISRSSYVSSGDH
jgi:hypothetical protein